MSAGPPLARWAQFAGGMKTTIAALALLLAAACGPAVAEDPCYPSDGGRLPIECCHRPPPRLPDAGPCPDGSTLTVVIDDCGAYKTCG